MGADVVARSLACALLLAGANAGCRTVSAPRLASPSAQETEHRSHLDHPVTRRDGQTATLKAFTKSEGLILVFMAEWCAVCRAEQADVEAYARRARDRGVVYIVSGMSAAETDALAQKRTITIPVLADPKGRLADALGIEGVPAIVHFDADGKRAGFARRVRDLPARTLRVEDAGTALGTSYHAVVIAASEASAQRDLEQARQYGTGFASHFSTWQQDSEINRVNHRADGQAIAISPELSALLRGALHVASTTDGAFDPTWSPIGELWAAAEARGALPTDVELHAALQGVGYDKLKLDGRALQFTTPKMALGIDGVAKGWIIDAIFTRLKERGHRNTIVNMGGDVRVSGLDHDGRPWLLRIPDPYRPSLTACSLRVTDTAVATSGNYFRFRDIGGQRIGHIVDPRTGRPPPFDGSATVLTADAAMADALATALFVMGPAAGLEYAKAVPGLDVVYVTRNGIRSTLPRGAIRPASAQAPTS